MMEDCCFVLLAGQHGFDLTLDTERKIIVNRIELEVLLERQPQRHPDNLFIPPDLNQ